MKKYFLAAALVALFGFTPGVVSAQVAPSPFGTGADFLARQNTYDSMTMNRMMTGGNGSRSRRQKKSVRHTKRRHSSSKSRRRSNRR